MTQLRWSPLVESAIQENLHALVPFATPLSLSSSSETRILRGLLVVHLRMGDFDIQCYKFHKQKTLAQGWFELPGVPDKFNPPSEADWEARHDYYYRSCSPSFYQIINKLQAIRESERGKTSRALYLMSDGAQNYLDSLASVLTRDAGWKFVMSSTDMAYNPEQQFISQAVDMAIAQRAQMFLGNGVCRLVLNLRRLS